MKKLFVMLVLVITVVGCTSTTITEDLKIHSISFKKFPNKKLIVDMKKYSSGAYAVSLSTNFFEDSMLDEFSVDNDVIKLKKGLKSIPLTRGKFNRLYRNLTSRGHVVTVKSGEKSFSFNTSDIGKSI